MPMDDNTVSLQITCITVVLLLLLRKKKLSNRDKRAGIIRKRRTTWTRQWLFRRDCGRGMANLIFNEIAVEDPKSFKNFTRMSVNTFEDLLSRVRTCIERKDTCFRECISARTRLLVTLRYLATGETFRNLSYSFRISVPSLSKIIPEVVESIHQVLKDDYLTTPTTKKQWLEIAKGFFTAWNFPNCLGALDGKHIAFRAKKADGSFYYNYKGFNSIVLMALVDADYNFVYVDVGCNGRVSDGGVYSNCNLSTAVEQNLLDFPEDNYLPNSQSKVPYVIVADDAFRLSTRIIKPFGQRSTKEEKIFNYRLSRARRVVENAFGILANRFQVLQRDINLDVDKVEKVTLACCALHNYIKKKDGRNYFFGVDYENTETVSLKPGEWRQNVYMTNLERCRVNRSSNQPLEIRNHFKHYFNTHGFVPWQWEAIKKFNF